MTAKKLLVLYPCNDTQRDNDKRTRHAMPEKYNIVLSGRHPAADPHQVALKLAALFKCTAEQPLFGHCPKPLDPSLQALDISTGIGIIFFDTFCDAVT